MQGDANDPAVTDNGDPAHFQRLESLCRREGGPEDQTEYDDSSFHSNEFTVTGSGTPR
jgi:hypothetical protein